MIRKIIQIDEEKCNGCGLCANACEEEAIAMVNGKAKLIRDDYCDGLGNCLPACPTGAISFVEREAAAYDEAAVAQNKRAKQAAQAPGGCPGSRTQAIRREEAQPAGGCPGSRAQAIRRAAVQAEAAPAVSELSQWPVQIKLVPVRAPYFDGADLLIAADCTAYAYGDFHREFIRGRITLIGCPKLDEGDYTEKLTEIIRQNDIRSVTVVRMQVPCCGGLERAAVNALKASGKFIPWQIRVVSTDGRIVG